MTFLGFNNALYGVTLSHFLPAFVSSNMSLSSCRGLAARRPLLLFVTGVRLDPHTS